MRKESRLECVWAFSGFPPQPSWQPCPSQENEKVGESSGSEAAEVVPARAVLHPSPPLLAAAGIAASTAAMADLLDREATLDSDEDGSGSGMEEDEEGGGGDGGLRTHTPSKKRHKAVISSDEDEDEEDDEEKAREEMRGFIAVRYIIKHLCLRFLFYRPDFLRFRTMTTTRDPGLGRSPVQGPGLTLAATGGARRRRRGRSADPGPAPAPTRTLTRTTWSSSRRTWA